MPKKRSIPRGIPMFDDEMEMDKALEDLGEISVVKGKIELSPRPELNTEVKEFFQKSVKYLNRNVKKGQVKPDEKGEMA